MKNPDQRNKYRASVIALSGTAYDKDGRPVDLTGVRVDIDIYRILEGYEIMNPQMQHVLKKVLCAGQRAGGKDLLQDYDDIITSTQSAIEMERQVIALKNQPLPQVVPDSLTLRTESILHPYDHV